MEHKILINVMSDDLAHPYKNIRFYTMDGKALGHTTEVLMNTDQMKNFSAVLDVEILVNDIKKELK